MGCKNLTQDLTNKVWFMDPSSPLDIRDYCLLKNNRGELLFYFFLCNISSKDIIAAKLDIVFLDAFGKKIGEDPYETIYIDIMIEAGKSKYTSKYTGLNPATRRLNLIVSEIAFLDSTVWIRGDYRQIETFATFPANSSELYMLRTIAGPTATNFYAEQNEYWQCVCGRINLSRSQQCPRCSLDRHSLKQFSYDISNIKKAFDEVNLQNKKHNICVLAIILGVIIMLYILINAIHHFRLG